MKDFHDASARRWRWCVVFWASRAAANNSIGWHTHISTVFSAVFLPHHVHIGSVRTGHGSQGTGQAKTYIPLDSSRRPNIGSSFRSTLWFSQPARKGSQPWRDPAGSQSDGGQTARQNSGRWPAARLGSAKAAAPHVGKAQLLSPNTLKLDRVEQTQKAPTSGSQRWMSLPSNKHELCNPTSWQKQL